MYKIIRRWKQQIQNRKQQTEIATGNESATNKNIETNATIHKHKRTAYGKWEHIMFLKQIRNQIQNN